MPGGANRPNQVPLYTHGSTSALYLPAVEGLRVVSVCEKARKRQRAEGDESVR
jgi:hypothetical protein